MQESLGNYALVDAGSGVEEPSLAIPAAFCLDPLGAGLVILELLDTRELAVLTELGEGINGVFSVGLGGGEEELGKREGGRQRGERGGSRERKEK